MKIQFINCDINQRVVQSQCSVGCGKGYSTREVKCMLSGTKVNELMCKSQLRPTATRHCETSIECKWKTGPWKQVRFNCRKLFFAWEKIKLKHKILNSVHVTDTPNDEFSASI